MYKVFASVAVFLLINDAYATDKPVTPKRNYNPAKTAQLSNIVKKDYATHAGAMEKLIKESLGADPNIHQSSVYTLLGYAASKDDTQLARCCLDHGANPNGVSSTGCTALMEAYSLPMATLLLDNNADVNHVGDYLQETVLHKGVCLVRPQLVALFCNRGAVSKQNVLGDSPLHILCRLSDSVQSVQFFEIAATLLFAGAPQDKNKNKETPSDIVRKRSPDLVQPFGRLVNIMPKVQQQQRKEQYGEQPFGYLAAHITNDPATIVMEYFIGRLQWNKKCWDQTKKMAQL